MSILSLLTTLILLVRQHKIHLLSYRCHSHQNRFQFYYLCKLSNKFNGKEAFGVMVIVATHLKYVLSAEHKLLILATSCEYAFETQLQMS